MILSNPTQIGSIYGIVSIAKNLIENLDRLISDTLTIKKIHDLVWPKEARKRPQSLWQFHNGDLPMFKKLSGKLFGKKVVKSTSDGFFLNVRCLDCKEQFNLFINKSWDLMQNFEEDGSVTYCLKKEIFGIGCTTRIHVNMQFDGRKNLISRQIENGEFIDE